MSCYCFPQSLDINTEDRTLSPPATFLFIVHDHLKNSHYYRFRFHGPESFTFKQQSFSRKSRTYVNSMYKLLPTVNTILLIRYHNIQFFFCCTNLYVVLSCY
jgi:hypothetical protein